jgi:uncharacterized membrane protein
MGKVSEQIAINARVERVFELWTDANRLPEWFPGTRSVSNVSGSLSEEGARYTQHLQGARAECEVTRVETPTLHEHKFKQSPPPVTGYAVIRFESAGVDSTTMRFDAEYELAGGAFGRMMDKLFLRHLAERRMRSELPRFKAFVENQAPTPS